MIKKKSQIKISHELGTHLCILRLPCHFYLDAIEQQQHFSLYVQFVHAYKGNQTRDETDVVVVVIRWQQDKNIKGA